MTVVGALVIVTVWRTKTPEPKDQIEMLNGPPRPPRQAQALSVRQVRKVSVPYVSLLSFYQRTGSQPDTSSCKGSLPATAAAGRGFSLRSADVDAVVNAVLLRNGATIVETGPHPGSD